MSDQAGESSPLSSTPEAGAPVPDWLGFGRGAEFQPQRVTKWLKLSPADVSRLVESPGESVSYSNAMPAPMLCRLIEVAEACNLVANFFGGDLGKTEKWFKAQNPMLGDIAPRDMARLGRFDRLRRFILNSVCGQATDHN